MAGCAVGPKYEPAQPQTAPAWQAALPQTDAAADLKQWWQQFTDPVLAGMIDAAQVSNPTLAQA
ncbi:MAG: efflux transporter outer membrane subunit, partial [Burkholderiaceae bacterium]